MRQAQIKIIVSDASDPQSILVSLIFIYLNYHFPRYAYLLYFCYMYRMPSRCLQTIRQPPHCDPPQ